MKLGLQRNAEVSFVLFKPREQQNRPEASSDKPMKDDLFFEAAKPYRFLFLSSPLWLAAVLIGLEYLGGQQVRTVIHFMTGSHAR